MGAAYECTLETTDDETFLFSILPRDAGGNAPTWANFSYAYSLVGCGVCLTLTEADGIEIDEATAALTIGPSDRSYRLRPGHYRHGFAMTHISSGVTTQHFDGTVTVSEGNLR